MRAYLRGVGIFAAGLNGWNAAAAVLAGEKPYEFSESNLPSPEILPPAERRRAASTVRCALAVAHEAMSMSGIAPDSVASVFASSGGDGDTLHQICEALALPERAVSPTRFHNSVHNAAAGYWSIATRSHTASTSVCAYDASFAAGLLEAMSLVATEKKHVLLVAYDCPYPQPLRALRPVRESFAAAFVLSPEPGALPLACWDVSLAEGAAPAPHDVPEALSANPAARALPLLAALAKNEERGIELEYLEGQHVCVKCKPGR